jgi:hypothetical protein
MNNYKDLSWDDIKAMYAETGRFIQETTQLVKETTQQMKETDQKIAESDRKFQKQYDRWLQKRKWLCLIKP